MRNFPRVGVAWRVAAAVALVAACVPLLGASANAATRRPVRTVSTTKPKSITNSTTGPTGKPTKTASKSTKPAKPVTRKTAPTRVVVAKTAPARTGPATVPATTPTTPTTPTVTPSVTTTTPSVVSAGPVPVTEVIAGGNPGATDSTVPGVATTTTTTIPAPTTTAPFPAAANPPTRATAASIDPYRGLGTWFDAFDWTVQKGKNPKVSSLTIDAVAAAGVQTIYIQASRYDSADVAEPERLLPIVNRAHELGMYVVVWYLPTLTDVNADLRRTVAVANLDVDGISIDIEARNVADVAERNRRLISYSQSLRQLLPGRFIANNIVQPNILDAVPNQWPTVYGQPPAGIKSYWAPFPYVEIAPFYDLWMIQSYWTQRSAGGGWRDAYKISVDNVVRLRATLGRVDLPVQIIGGVGDKPQTPNDLAGLLKANTEMGGVGLSFYDWLVTPPSWWPTLWNARVVPAGAAPDPRFVPIAPPPYAAPVQPVLQPPSTTIPVPVPTTATLPPGPTIVIVEPATTVPPASTSPPPP